MRCVISMRIFSWIAATWRISWMINKQQSVEIYIKKMKFIDWHTSCHQWHISIFMWNDARHATTTMATCRIVLPNAQIRVYYKKKNWKTKGKITFTARASCNLSVRGVFMFCRAWIVQILHAKKISYGQPVWRATNNRNEIWSYICGCRILCYREGKYIMMNDNHRFYFFYSVKDRCQTQNHKVMK